MLSRGSARAAAVAAALGLFFLSGCILGTDEDDKPKEPTPDYRPLTDKDNVIHNLIESYKWCDIEEYEKLLHPDYVWRNQERDVVMGGLPEYFTRDEDLASTGNLFKAKSGTHPDPLVIVNALNLVIQAGAWQGITEIDGSPCEDCWETTRLYEIAVVSPAMTLYADDYVKFVVVPVTEGGKTLYKIRRADDIHAD
ncbi:MAG: hypothetical protein C4574_03120 [Candidatus Latescibacterota bacterium]|jgi:hypothetical protein|nr:MAG: hypothetical protein C4574_03120 [Candidatus Latescibacterota bacterium]